MSAADRIRASVARLGAIPRHGHWLDSGPNVRTEEGGYLMAVADPQMRTDQQDAVTAHIALLASPHVAAALADLLEALDGYDLSTLGDTHWALRKLQAAIDGSGT